VKAILKPIFELITGEYALFDNVLYNYVAMAVIGLIAFVVAFALVGKLYAADMIEGRGVGSLLHWIIRLVVFIVVFYVFSLIVWAIRAFLALPWWGIVLVIAAVIALITIIVKRRSN
jgi:hypothetical protein